MTIALQFFFVYVLINVRRSLHSMHKLWLVARAFGQEDVTLFKFHRIFLDIPHIQTECENHHEIFCGIMSVPQNIVMDMNNVVKVKFFSRRYLNPHVIVHECRDS